MANLVKELVSGVVDSALKEILKKTRTTATKRTRRRNRKTASDGGILADIVEVAFRKPAKKQVSRRRTAASRNKLRRRAKS